MKQISIHTIVKTACAILVMMAIAPLANAQMFGGLIKSSAHAVLSCGSYSLSPTFMYANVDNACTAYVAYTAGNGGRYSQGASVASSGVTGLTATLQAGTLASGSGNLTYIITGTPSGTGTATFVITFCGQSCSLSVPINSLSDVLPAYSNILVNAPMQRWTIPSVYDTDYIPYTTPTGPATAASVAADGIAEPTIDLQGTLSSMKIAMSVGALGSGGTLPAYAITVNVPASLTQDNISRNITLSWSAQSFKDNGLSFFADVTVQGGTINVKKMDINAGVGSDGLGVLLAKFSFPTFDSNNWFTQTIGTFEFRAIAGIPDRMYNKTDNTGTMEHQFLYLPVQGEDGSWWLNNNLGADYSNRSNGNYFNITQQATSKTDYHAYGSLFQWGRGPDGHELIDWSGSTDGTPKSGTSLTLSNTDVPTDNNFIKAIGAPYDWRLNQNDALWETGINNPCPVGFSVPGNDKLSRLCLAANIDNSTTAANTKLRFTVTGYRSYLMGDLSDTGSKGYYWTSTTDLSHAFGRTIRSSDQFMSSSIRASGHAVRCIKN